VHLVLAELQNTAAAQYAAARVPTLWTVDAIEPYSDLLTLSEDSNGVAICHPYHCGREGRRDLFRRERQEEND
jgi:hypothetical protein